MDYESIIKLYDQEKKDKILSLSIVNKEKMHQDNQYDGQALNYFFILWQQQFPNVRQSKTCTGCRKSVCHFFHKIADYINTENVKKENEKIKKEKLVKYLEKANKKLKTTKSKKKLSKK